jgi:S-formylglutathione hydrolase FrmB
MRRPLRLTVLVLALVACLCLYYYHVENAVRVETVQFQSRLVGKTLPYDVVLPRGYGLLTARGTRYPVLYLLHGWGGSHSSWISESSLVRYAAQHQLIIVTPEGGDNWYTDGASSGADKYESYVLQELIPDVENRFRTLKNRGGRAVAGYSMGGYGALKFAFKHPEVFTLAASMSGAFDAATRTDDPSIMRIFGEAGGPVREANDLFKLAREIPRERARQLPFLYLDCGTEDPWTAANREMSGIFLERGIVHEYRQLRGAHVWPYWDRQLPEILSLTEEMLLPAQP